MNEEGKEKEQKNVNKARVLIITGWLRGGV